MSALDVLLVEELDRLRAVYRAALDVLEAAEQRKRLGDEHAMREWMRLPALLRLRVVEMRDFDRSASR